jgi:hypothetical protein
MATGLRTQGTGRRVQGALANTAHNHFTLSGGLTAEENLQHLLYGAEGLGRGGVNTFGSEGTELLQFLVDVLMRLGLGTVQQQ